MKLAQRKQKDNNFCDEKETETQKKEKGCQEEIKMEIEVDNSNQLIGSLSTQASNKIKSSFDLKTLNICNTNTIIIPESSNLENEMQNKLQIYGRSHSNNCKLEKEIFKFNFVNKEEDISFLGEYLNELYSNLLQDEIELIYKPKLGYMSIQNDINEQMRAILIDWLIEVHYRFRLKSETLFQTVWIIDTYLSMFPIMRAKLQLLGISSLLISCKSQEIYYPQLNDLIDITDGAYIKEELINMESHILKVLNFNIISPTSNDFFNIIAKSFNFDDRQYFLGKYFLESTLIDYQMLKYSSSVLAVSCAYIVMKFFGINNYRILYSNDVINDYCPQKAIKDTAKDICFLVKNLSQSSLKAVKDKYSLPYFYNVAQFCEQK